MRSRSKYELDHPTIIRLFDSAGITGASNIRSLGDGEYNSVYAVDVGKMGYAVKIAPLDGSTALSYEKNMMEQEVYYYGQMKTAGIRVPEIHHTDFSRSLIPADWFIMERLSGTQFDKADFKGKEKEAADEALAGMVARMHTVDGEMFGYRQTGLEPDWYAAIHGMVSRLISDCHQLRRPTPRGRKLLRYIERNRAILEKVECRLINFDIWPANIFILERADKEGNSAPGLAWIDPERCLWGDRIADFVCLDFMSMTLDGKKNAIEAYNRTAEMPIRIGDEERIRLAMMLCYLGLIMEVEKYARYSLFNHGYWRNVIVCRWLFRAGFRTLRDLSPS